MVGRNKKGYVRTLEAFIAFFITFLFVVFVVLKGVETNSDRPELQVLETLEQQSSFRDCVYSNNETCMREEIDQFIPLTYQFNVGFTADPPQTDGNIFTETLFVTGDSTGDYKVIYLYYWIVR